ncbi:GD24349, partial [Drosophila simulans]
SRQQLEVQSAAEQQRLRRRSEGDAPTQEKQYSKEQPHTSNSHSVEAVDSAQPNNPKGSRRASLGDPDFAATRSETGSGQLQLIEGPKTGFGSGQHVRCRNSKCDQSTSPSDAKKLYKSCHNCSHLYCSRECRRAHWEKHRKACLHSRASNICRQVLATCKDDIDSQRHLSLLARKGSLSQGRGVVRVLFRSAEAAEGFIKNGFQCMGEASYVRWPDLMPAEMGLELYSELLKLSTEYKPETKMLIYVAICVVSEAPGMGQAPVRWERQLVSRCAKLKLCKTVLAELEQHQAALLQPVSVVAVPERTEILILTFNPGQHSNRELILSNILEILIRRGVMLSKHYPEVFERLQTYSEGQSDKFNPVTLHPRDTQTGQNFVCIIMAVHTDNELTKLPSAADGGNRVTTIDVGSPAALVQLELGDDQIFKTKSRDS